MAPYSGSGSFPRLTRSKVGASLPVEEPMLTYIIIIKQETSVAENIFIIKGLLGHFASQKRTRSWSITSKPSEV